MQGTCNREGAPAATEAPSDIDLDQEADAIVAELFSPDHAAARFGVGERTLKTSALDPQLCLKTLNGGAP
jgi:hypothetical protein